MMQHPDQTIVSARAPCGEVKGVRAGSVFRFSGIPYAKPPVGSLRFLPPEPLTRSDAVIDATREPAAPAQPLRVQPAWMPDARIVTMSEDCLTLNVWTPGLDAARRPTLVHVFGGGFQNGTAYDELRAAGSLAAAGDVVVVRVNFRLGALGFLHLGEIWGSPYKAGNVALLDLVAGLRWVQENIRSFGGDPDNVTLFGLSSGAFMAAALFGVAGTDGVFHRAFLQSGSASRIIERSTGAQQAAAFLATIDVGVGDRAALEAVDVASILAAQDKIVATDLGERNAPGGHTLGIVFDGVTLKEHPLTALSNGKHKNIPIVLGITRDEACLWFALGVMKSPETETGLLNEMTRFVGADKARRLLVVYRAIDASASLAVIRERFLTDAIYRVPAWRTAQAHMSAGGQAYLYEFAWTPSVEGGRLGAAHGFDEPFVWGVCDPQRWPFQAGAQHQARELAAAMSGALLNFARSGDPGWRRASGERVFHVFGDEQTSEVDRSRIIDVFSD